VLLSVVLPIALAAIMFGMGLSLTKADFGRLLVTPKPVIVGLGGQIVLLPLLAYGIAVLFQLETSLAIGLMILSACPGGTMSNVISQLCRANIALSVTLTAITTVVCVFTTPLIIAWSINHFSDVSLTSFSLLGTTIGLIAITLIPVTLGLFIRAKYTKWGQKYEVYFRRFSGIFMFFMIAFVLRENWGLFIDSFGKVAGAAIALNFIATFLGLGLGKLFGLSQRDGNTLGIEVGIQNATVAITIAATFLEQDQFAVTAGVYGITMYLGVIIPALLSDRISR